MTVNPKIQKWDSEDIEKVQLHWALLVLLASYPSGKAKFRAFTKRSTYLLIEIDPTQTQVTYARDRTRHLINEMAKFGAVELIKTGRQTSHIRLLSASARKLLIHDSLGFSINKYRTTRSGGVKALASYLEVEERTVWKWLSGQNTPQMRYLNKLSFYLADFEVNVLNQQILLKRLLNFYLQIFQALGLNQKESIRAGSWLRKHHYDKVVDAGMELIGERQGFEAAWKEYELNFQEIVGLSGEAE